MGVLPDNEFFSRASDGTARVHLRAWRYLTAWLNGFHNEALSSSTYFVYEPLVWPEEHDGLFFQISVG